MPCSQNERLVDHIEASQEAGSRADACQEHSVGTAWSRLRCQEVAVVTLGLNDSVTHTC